MAPVRRYLRISKYSVLECRIYLDNPALAQSWLLNPRSPVLPRVIESVRPWVLPKLREERERTRKKSSNRRKGIKDTVTEEDFEVSIFLTETSTRHSILSKQKHFHEKPPPKMQSNANKLMGETNETPFDVDADTDAPILQEEGSDEEGGLSNIPAAPAADAHGSKRRRAAQSYEEVDDSEDEGTTSAIEIDSDTEQPPPKRLRDGDSDPDGTDDGGDPGDDKKKMAMDVSYEGFAIYGRVLCLVVRKRDGSRSKPGAKAVSGGSGAQPVGQAKMENWITSTQIPVGEEIP